jgi:beta-galactosidase
VLINKLSGKALDVPGGTFDLEERIIQYEVNRRFNQRWRWIRQDKSCLIQNVLTGLFLDIAGESRSSGAKVIQWSHTGNTNQQWIPEA